MFPSRTFLTALLILGCTAIEPASARDDAPGAEARETALDNLLSERESPEALDSVIEAARKAGVSEQAILEARFLYHVDRREDAAIAGMLPGFLKQNENFKIGDSVIFGVKEDWLAVLEYVQAIASLRQGDKPGFKNHITEAFWLSPRQAAAFAPHIERLRLEETMSTVKVDFATRFATLVPGEPVSLEKISTGTKAVLLHFWSPWSRECEESLPDFVATAIQLTANGVAVASVLPDDSGKQLADARTMIRPLGTKPPGFWLVDSTKQPIARDLRVQNLPTMVLVSADGRVLFNGDPTDPQFWQALANVNPAIERPDAKHAQTD